MEEVIGSFDVKEGHNQIRVTKQDYMGKSYVDIRVYYRKEGEWKPGKKGITVPQAEAKTLAKLIMQALDSEADEKPQNTTID